MTCADLRELLNVHADGELDPIRSLQVEQHLRDCPACGEACGRLRALRRALTQERLHQAAPNHLHTAIRSWLRAAERAEMPRRWPRRGLAVAASLALLALAAWWAALAWRDERLAREVVANHIRSLMAGHLLDVTSSDRHTVKPWFPGKLDFAPPVPDLAEDDFLLLGGRLDYLDGRPVAALVYGRGRHVINLFVWPAAAGPDLRAGLLRRQGYHLVHWSGGGMAWWAVSDLNAAELQGFTRLIQEQTSHAAGP